MNNSQKDKKNNVPERKKKKAGHMLGAGTELSENKTRQQGGKECWL